MALSKPAKITSGGDDLDDGLEYDQNAATSDIGSDVENLNEDQLDLEGEGDRPVLDDDDSDGELRAGAKRKAEIIKDESVKKKKQKRPPKTMSDISITTPPTYLKPDQLLSLLRSSLLESNPALTPMEITDRLPPLSTLLPPPEHASSSTSDPTSLEPLKKRISGLLKKNGKIIPGKPRIIILCLSGLRCVDVVREVRDVRGDGQVAKLFAKHMKPAEQEKFVKGNKVSIAVGTPARIGKFLSEGTIGVDKNTVVLLDIGHKDSIKETRTLLTLPEVRDELWRSVLSGLAWKAILDGGARVGAC